jgi:hypothetical protein
VLFALWTLLSKLSGLRNNEPGRELSTALGLTVAAGTLGAFLSFLLVMLV